MYIKHEKFISISAIAQIFTISYLRVDIILIFFKRIIGFDLIIGFDPMNFRNLIFNPSALSKGGGNSHLMLNSDLDPDHNYYNTIINYIDTCDYHDEDSFKRIATDSANTEFSILHLNIRSILSKYDDFKTYIRSLEHEFSIIGLTETWLNSSNANDFPLPNYHSTGMVRKNKQGGGVSLYIN